MEEAQEIAPQNEQKEPPKKKKNMVRGYPNDILLQELADAAATTLNPATGKRFRLGGLQIKVKKPHGFPGEMQNNTDGIWKYLLHCHREQMAVKRLKEGLKGLGVK